MGLGGGGEAISAAMLLLLLRGRAFRRFFVVGRIKVRFFEADGRRGADEKLVGAFRQPAFRQRIKLRPYTPPAPSSSSLRSFVVRLRPGFKNYYK